MYKKVKRCFVTAVFFSFIFTIYLVTKELLFTPDLFTFSSYEPSHSLTGYLVNTPGCKIPHIEPFDQTIRHFFILNDIQIHCNDSSAATYIDNDVLRINHTALHSYHDELEECFYTPILRRNLSDEDYDFGKDVTFKSDIKVTFEFIRVACYGKKGGLIYTNFHAFILEKEDVEKRCKPKEDALKLVPNGQRKPSVIMIGVDSVSRLNFVRFFRKTRSYLLKEMKAFEMQGYNKVADNTFVNLSPMFAGKFVEELPWNETLYKQPFDKYPFIWKNFSEEGYRTLFAEDAPEISIFNYMKGGFRTPPMDYYLRPYSLAVEYHGSMWNQNHHCVGDRLETTMVLDWVKEFAVKFRKQPSLAFAFLTRLTHDEVNRAGVADKPYYDFIRYMHKEGTFDDTILIFFSDHGMRYGDLRNTYIGKMEERLPFMYVAVPPWFQNKFPKMTHNLKVNTHKLTTPFDVYETLKVILNLKEDIKGPPDKQTRGVSFFQAISPERSCEQAGILHHWCTCHKTEIVDTKSKTIKNAADFFVDYINGELSAYGGLCSVLKVKQIKEAFRHVINEKVLTFQESLNDVIGRTVKFGDASEQRLDYTLSIQTSPGDGLFEVTIRYEPKKYNFEIIGDISRINKYGKQSYCIDRHSLKKYCYCSM